MLSSQILMLMGVGLVIATIIVCSWIAAFAVIGGLVLGAWWMAQWQYEDIARGYK